MLYLYIRLSCNCSSCISQFTGIVLLPQERIGTTENDEPYFDLPLFDVMLIAKSTNFFSPKNKLGEGGFGSVYKVIIMLSSNYENICNHIVV